ncbi:hypothetical protein CR513_01903, partial [Mucuna pruriens]
MILNASSPLISLPTGFGVLREEFKDVFPKDMPYGLPPLRGIEHHIDLTLRATLPNRATYRTNLEESKEIQKQVGKLMEKGWWLVMPFVLTNAPKHFYEIDESCLEKPYWQVYGFVVGSHGVKINEEKVKVIQEWPIPKTVSELKYDASNVEHDGAKGEVRLELGEKKEKENKSKEREMREWGRKKREGEERKEKKEYEKRKRREKKERKRGEKEMTRREKREKRLREGESKEINER